MAIPVLIGATVISAIGAIRQGQAAAGAAKYNAAIAEQNAQIAESQSVPALQAQDRDYQRRIGSATASYGASGVDGSSGSPLDVLADSARQSALDAATLKYNYELRKRGYLAQSALDLSNASNSRAAGYFNATSSILNGMGSYAALTAPKPAAGTPIPGTG